jgi:prepilin-type N-terminal cleavage/methylation domain-containing protein
MRSLVNTACHPKCAQPGDAGFTLLELMISAAIFLLVAAAVSLSLATLAQANGDSSQQAIDQNEAQLVVQVASRDLRTAAIAPGSTGAALTPPTPFLSATGNSVSFTAELWTVTQPVTVTLSVTASGTLQEQVTQSTGSCTATPSTFSWTGQTSHTSEYGGDLTNSLASNPVTPLFTYWTSAGVQIVPNPVAGPLTNAQLSGIAQVDVTADVLNPSSPYNAPATVLSTDVSILNLGYNTTGTVCS